MKIPLSQDPGREYTLHHFLIIGIQETTKLSILVIDSAAG